MKLKLVALSTGFAIALGGCTLNPIGEDPGINRDSNNNAVPEEATDDGAFAPEQDMSAPVTVDPATGLPTPPAAGPMAGVDPGGQAPEPVVIDPDEEAPAGDIVSEPEAAPDEPIPPPDALIDGGVPFGDAGDAGDAAVPLGAR